MPALRKLIPEDDLLTGRQVKKVLRGFLHRHKKADPADRLKCLIFIRNNGRDGVIRTLDP